MLLAVLRNEDDLVARLEGIGNEEAFAAGGLSGSFGGLGRSFGRLGRSLGGLSRSLGRLSRSFGRLGGSFSRLGGSFGGLSRSFGRLGRSRGGLSRSGGRLGRGDGAAQNEELHREDRFARLGIIVGAELVVLCVPLDVLRVAGGAGRGGADEIDAVSRHCLVDLPGVVGRREAQALRRGQGLARVVREDEAVFGLLDVPDDLAVAGDDRVIGDRDVDARAVVGGNGVLRHCLLCTGVVDDDLIAVLQGRGQNVLILRRRGGGLGGSFGGLGRSFGGLGGSFGRLGGSFGGLGGSLGEFSRGDGRLGRSGRRLRRVYGALRKGAGDVVVLIALAFPDRELEDEARVAFDQALRHDHAVFDAIVRRVGDVLQQVAAFDRDDLKRRIFLSGVVHRVGRARREEIEVGVLGIFTLVVVVLIDEVDRAVVGNGNVEGAGVLVVRRQGGAGNGRRLGGDVAVGVVAGALVVVGVLFVADDDARGRVVDHDAVAVLKGQAGRSLGRLGRGGSRLGRRLGRLRRSGSRLGRRDGLGELEDRQNAGIAGGRRVALRISAELEHAAVVTEQQTAVVVRRQKAAGCALAAGQGEVNACIVELDGRAGSPVDVLAVGTLEAEAARHGAGFQRPDRFAAGGTLEADVDHVVAHGNFFRSQRVADGGAVVGHRVVLAVVFRDKDDLVACLEGIGNFKVLAAGDGGRLGRSSGGLGGRGGRLRRSGSRLGGSGSRLGGSGGRLGRGRAAALHEQLHREDGFARLGIVVGAELGVLVVPLDHLGVAGGAGRRRAGDVDAVRGSRRGDRPHVIGSREAQALRRRQGLARVVGEDEARAGGLDAPDDLAVVGHDLVVSDGDVSARAIVGGNRFLAHRLLRAGIVDDDFVAVFQGRGQDVLVAARSRGGLGRSRGRLGGSRRRLGRSRGRLGRGRAAALHEQLHREDGFAGLGIVVGAELGVLVVPLDHLGVAGGADGGGAGDVDAVRGSRRGDRPHVVGRRKAQALRRRQGLARVVGEDEAAAGGLDRPDDLAVAGDDLVVADGHVSARAVVGGDGVLAHRLLRAGVVDDDFIAVLQGRREHILVAARRGGGFGRAGGRLGGSGGRLGRADRSAVLVDGQILAVLAGRVGAHVRTELRNARVVAEADASAGRNINGEFGNALAAGDGQVVAGIRQRQGSSRAAPADVLAVGALEGVGAGSAARADFPNGFAARRAAQADVDGVAVHGDFLGAEGVAGSGAVGHRVVLAVVRRDEDDLIAYRDGIRNDEGVAAGDGGRLSRRGRRLGRGDGRALDVELPAEVVGLRRGIAGGVTGDVGHVLAGVVVALDVGGAVAVGEGRVLDVGKAVRPGDLPLAVRAGVVRVVGQLEVVAGDPHHDRVGAVGEAERAVAVVNDLPDDGSVRGSDLVVGNGDRLRFEIPVVVVLVLDRHAMARAVDHDLVAALDGGGQSKLAARRGGGLGRAGGRLGRSRGRLGRGDGSALDVELPAEVVGLRRGITGGVTGNVGLVLACVVVALNVSRTVAVGEGGVLDVGQAVRPVDLPLAVRAGIVRVVGQLEVVAGDPADDRVGAVREAEAAVAVVNDLPDDGSVRGSDLVVGNGDRLRNEIPVVVVLVLDRHLVTRAVDNDFVAALDGGREAEFRGHGAGGRLGRAGRGGRLGRGDAARALDEELPAEIVGLRGRIAGGVAGDVGLVLGGVVVALDVGRTVGVREGRVLDVGQAVDPLHDPVAVRALIAGVVGQLEVVAGDPAGDLVDAVGELHAAVGILADLPDDLFGRIDELIVGRLDGFGNEVPVVVVLVLDRHLVARAVDDDLIAVGNGGGEGEDVLLVDRLAAGVDRDTAAAVDGGVVGAERHERALGNDLRLAVHGREGLDVVRQDHVVFHDVVEHVDRTVKHVEAVAHLAQGVVVAREVVGGLLIQRDVLAGILVPDLDVGDAVVAGRAAGPDALVVLADGALDVGVDVVGQAGDLEEAAALSGAHVTGAPFQSIQDLLTGDGLQAGDVAEGVDVLAGLVGDIAGDGLVAHAAAVHDGNVNVEAHVVEQVVQRVGSEVAGVGLFLADESGAVFVVVEGQGGVADDLAEHAVDRVHPLVLQRGDRGVGAVVARDQLGAERVLREVDGHLADRAEVAAGLGQNDLILAGVLYELLLDGAMGVAVDEGVQAGGVGDQVFRGPGLGGDVVAQVAQRDDIVGAFGLGRVDRGLHGGVQVSAGHTAGDAVDVVAGLILEVRGRGLREGFGRGDADKGDLLAFDLEDLVGVEDVRALDAVGFMIEVRGNVRELRPADGVHRAFHAVVELVVAERRQIVA